MKLLTIITSLIFMTSTFANEYYSLNHQCYADGDYTSISRPYTKELPNRIYFNMQQTMIRANNKVVKMEVSGDEILSNAISKLKYNLKDYYDSYERRKVHRGYKLNFDKISASDTRELLIKMGATNVPPLPYGIGKISLKSRLRLRSKVSIKKQIHFPKDVNDGLSFHIKIICSKSPSHGKYYKDFRDVNVSSGGRVLNSNRESGKEIKEEEMDITEVNNIAKKVLRS